MEKYFRAWSKKEKIMYPVFTPFHEHKSIMEQTDLPLHIAPWKDFIIMQYSGHKDKNKVKIFEGDIVNTFLNGEIVAVHEITIYDFEWVRTRHDRLEVIGNIYKDKKLKKLHYL